MHSLLRYLSFTAIFTTKKVIFSEATNKLAHFTMFQMVEYFLERSILAVMILDMVSPF